ncbi:lysine/arginine/ornithine ABC transporter substrate-binding protein [Albimonas pacifica]|uniref:Polar amino acid transport system substrate-binding protein/arginine/ornithine transport system substrate-binding protein n=1 Tax=Albimonas pacifica TaxID=1114924 RepID=A0A1I3JXA9_9RHOB|nr:lysine/arginine/ornithine ABC transporter substrate-binding protein [Albimonas pacifica]SFI64585.1 polar amino acid transport system substrate-binding protein/arginine/ornithine transport system substrate-binding protein [Albimonas pacifica]
MSRKTLAGALAAAAFALSAQAAAAEDLKICVEGAYPPFSETTASGEVVGFDIDMANAMCAAMGATCEMVKTDWDGIIPALIERKCDAIVASMSITPDRAQVIDFSAKYYNTPAAFIAAEGTEMTTTPEGLSGKTVGVQRGTIHQQFMEGEFPDVELKLYGTQDEAYLDLQSGRVDALVADQIAMDEGFIKTDAGAGYAFFGDTFSIPKYHGEGAGVGVRKGSDLAGRFTDAIAEIRASGEYDEIQKKYFDFDIYGG